MTDCKDDEENRAPVHFRTASHGGGTPGIAGRVAIGLGGAHAAIRFRKDDVAVEAVGTGRLLLYTKAWMWVIDQPQTLAFDAEQLVALETRDGGGSGLPVHEEVQRLARVVVQSTQMPELVKPSNVADVFLAAFVDRAGDRLGDEPVSARCERIHCIERAGVPI